MPKPTVSSELLAELHRMLHQLSDLRSRLKRGPMMIKAQTENVARIEGALAEAKANVQKLKMTVDERELQLKEREARIVDIRGKLNSANTNREYQSFLEQIAADEQANSVLSDEILEMFDRVQEAETAVEEVVSNKTAAEKELAEITERVHSQRDSLETEAGRIETELAEAESKLPMEIRVDYQRLVKAKGEEALARYEGNTCGGCYQTLTPQTENELLMSRVVFCRACGSLLYIDKSSS